VAVALSSELSSHRELYPYKLLKRQFHGVLCPVMTPAKRGTPSKIIKSLDPKRTGLDGFQRAPCLE
jgi:hypothetical protein